MKKHTIALTAACAGLVSSLSAQSLYDLAPEDSTTESLPLTFTAGFNVGFDNNPTPIVNNDDESLYGQAYVGGAFLNQSPQTTLSAGAQVGVIHYFDNLDFRGQNVDDTAYTASLYLNWTHRVSERLRFVSQNSITYELEPDYSVGFQAQRQVGNYLRWYSDNAVGYRWSERLATYTGVRFDGLTFDDFNAGDRLIVMFYNDLRYQVSERTVATLKYRYQDVDAASPIPDSENHFILAGLEHRFSPNSTAVILGGLQIREVDSGANLVGRDGTSPYLEASLRTRVNQQFSLRSYARYGVEDWSRGIQFPNIPTLAVYGGVETFRLGVTGNYQVSEQVTLSGGVNLAFMDFEDQQTVVGPSSLSEELVNFFIGIDYMVNDNLSLNARYNLEDLSSDANRNYDRNRFSVGASTTF